MPRELTEEEIIEQLVDAGWSRHEAEDEVKRMLKEDTEEDEEDLPFYGRYKMSEHILDTKITKVYPGPTGKSEHGEWKVWNLYLDKGDKKKFGYMWSGKKPIPVEGMQIKHIEYEIEHTEKDGKTYENCKIKKLELPDKSTPEAIPNASEDLGPIPKATNNRDASFYVAYASQMWCAMVSRLPEEIVSEMKLSEEADLVTKVGLGIMAMVMENTSSEVQNTATEESKPQPKGKAKAKSDKANGAPSKVMCDNDEAPHKGIEVIPIYCRTQCKLKDTCATAKQLREAE